MTRKTPDTIADSLDVSDQFLTQTDKTMKTIRTTLLRPKGTQMPTEQDVVDDLNYARMTIQDVMMKGSALLNDALEIAQESKHPRAIEVAAGLMKQLADISSNLIELDERAQQKTDEDKPQEVHNHLHCTTDELSKLLEERDRQRREDS